MYQQNCLTQPQLKPIELYQQYAYNIELKVIGS